MIEEMLMKHQKEDQMDDKTKMNIYTENNWQEKLIKARNNWNWKGVKLHGLIK